ncbi:MAG: ABC transporter substrate binding protein [Desulfobacterales bacterium]|nr:ABC transporter substrate binding protein [Desulfobacterales bacterium]
MSGKTAIVVSRQIRPFIEVLEGIRSVFKDIPGAAAETYFLDQMDEARQDQALAKFGDGGYRIFLAIGPEAAELLWNRLPAADGGKIYSVVRNPEKNISALDREQCGVPLNIPPAEQVRRIHQGLPGIERIGIIYDPAHNEAFYEAAQAAAASLGILIKPLRVNSRQSISEILRAHLDSIDCLWMIPDQTVISETIIHYVIKTCLVQGKSVIGYNKFFYESGACLSFVFDFHQIGRQTGAMVADLYQGKPCGRQTPAYEVWLNKRVCKRLETELPENPPPMIKVQP